MFSLGIDLGGTYIKAVIVAENTAILGHLEVETRVSGGYDTVIEQICQIAAQLSIECKIPFSYITKTGIGIPGIINGSKGPVLFAPNVGWYNVNPVPVLEEKLGMPVYLGNDADCMALAENACGAGRPYRHFLMLTLGTAVGGALVANDELFNGFGPYGGEIGHIPLVHGGFPCSCGVNGCFEQYGSAEALKRLAVESAKKDDTSLLWSLCSGNLTYIEAEHVFTATELGDKTATDVLDEFVTYLCEGIAGLVNIFRPEAVILGGGLANAGAPLFDRVNQRLANLTYASEFIQAPPVIKTQLDQHSGAVGAAMLRQK